MRWLRLPALAAVAALVAAVATASASTDATGDRAISSRAALERSIVREINVLRADRGLPRLVASQPLAKASTSHSRDMARTGFFDHSSPTRGSFDRRIRRYYSAGGYREWRAGENLLWASPEIDAKRAVELWLQSPAHRRILLTQGWREIGISAVHTATAPRVFAGLDVTIVTATFGARIR